MSPEHGYNPFNSPEFRKEMSEMFDDKLGKLKEVVDDHGDRITALERWRWAIVGAGALLVFLVKLWAGTR
jgi:hypothetical protein